MTTFSGILERYGDEISLYAPDGTATDTKGFVQPVMHRTAEKTFSQETRLGMRDRSRYYGFIPAGSGECEYLICDGAAYDVVKSESYKVAGEVSHIELLLEKREDIYERA